MTEEKPHKFSDDEIQSLIAQAEKMQLISNLSMVPKSDEVPQKNAAHYLWPVRFFIPLTLFAFAICAFYLHLQRATEPLHPIEELKEMTLVQKKRLLLKNAKPACQTLEHSVQTLAKQRNAHLQQASSHLQSLLEENKKNPIADFSSSYHQAVSIYLEAELAENQEISLSLEKLFKESSLKKREEFELFDLVIEETKLKPYLPPAVAQKLALPLHWHCDCKALHEAFIP